VLLLHKFAALVQNNGSKLRPEKGAIRLVMSIDGAKYSRLMGPTYAGSLRQTGGRFSRRRLMQAGVATGFVASTSYLGWAAATRNAFAANPSPNGFSHAEAEFGNLFYDYGSQNLMEVAAAADIPELIEFRDSGEQDTAGLALADNNEIAPELVPLPRARPDANRVQIAEAIVPLPALRRGNAIPTKLDLPVNATPSVPSGIAVASQPSISGSGRRVYTPSEALSERLGRSRRTLRVHGVNIGERLNITYFRNGRYDTSALAELDNLFRDRHSRKVAEIDPGVYDQLFAISNVFQGREVNMLSGYRAPETNEAMRRRMSGVAKFSYHVRAQAVDFYLSNVSISEIHIEALRLTVGGVGYYPGSNFVHLDTGPLRNWPSRYHGMGSRYRQT